MKFEYRDYELSNAIIDIAAGPFGSNLKVSCFTETGFPIIDGANLKGITVTDNITKFVSEDKARSLHRSIAKRRDIVVTISGNVGQISYIPDNSQYEEYLCSQRQFRVTFDESKIYVPYLVYYLHSVEGRSKILAFANQTGVPALSQPLKNFRKIKIDLPSLENQHKIAAILSALDEKIATNRAINDNLQQQAMAIFDDMFPNISNGKNTIGDTITPKRGKSLLSKNAVFGKVPVVAGGLEPSTYHNIANTVAPVLAISASGANAGYVSLWNVPIWSSDSSFIDTSMTDDVYFWYVLLKKRQNEIYDAQTGSAQPHIYPQHIAAMPIIDLSIDEVHNYTSTVTPIFDIIGHNKDENLRLSTLRDALLPKLMSGELDVSAIEL